MNSDTKWRVAWASWFAAFGVAETIAIRSANPDAPLSATLRLALGVRKTSAHRRAGQLAFGSFIGWLFFHLWRDVVDEE